MPRDGAQTRERLLDAAERLFERNGFAATSVDAILEESGSSKGAFFHHFPTKAALADSLVDRYVANDLASLERGLAAAASETDPSAALLAFLDYYVGRAAFMTSDSACLYIAVLVERDLLHEESSQRVNESIFTWRSAVADLVDKAYASEGITDGPTPDDLADQLFVIFEGSYLLCRALGSPEPMRAQLRVFRRLVAGLLGG